MKNSTPLYASWRHAFKLDPNKELSDEALEAICESGSDGILIGGTDGVTYDNVTELLGRVRSYAIPCVQEVSRLDAVVPGFDHYFIPLVVNAGRAEWLLQPHMEAIKQYGRLIPWHELTVEGYVVLNPDSKVGRLTASVQPNSIDDLFVYTTLTDRLLQLPILYLEYSGIYGDPSWIEQVQRRTTHSHLFYGGGIGNQEQAQVMSERADTIVVGNLIYEDWRRALETVSQQPSSI